MRSSVVKILAAGFVCVVLAAGGWYVVHRPMNPAARAEQLEQRGDVRGAALEWRNAVAASPKSAGPHLALARVLLRFYDPLAAEAQFREAGTLGADQWEVFTGLGQAYVAQGRWADVLGKIPGQGPTPEISARLLMLHAIAELAQNDIPSAAATLATAQREAPGRVETVLIAARVALAKNERAEARARVDEALRLDPHQVDALLMQVQLLVGQGDAAAALAAADRAVEASPWSPPARLDRANQFMVAGQDDKARLDVDAVLSRFPNFPGAMFLNAMLLARAGHYKDAMVAFERLSPVIEQYPRALYVQSLVASNLGNPETAVSLAQRYTTRVPGDPDGVRLLARARLAARHPELVAPALEAAVARGQTDPETLDLLGAAYAATGDAAAATRVRQRAAALAPESADALTGLGRSQLRQGDAAAAAATLERSVQIAPDQPAAAEALIDAAIGTGDLAKAQAALDQLRAQRGESETVGILTATLLLARNEVERARTTLVAVTKAYPQSAAAQVGLARVLALQGHAAAAEAMLGAVLAADPTNLAALATELQLRLQDQQFPPAIQAFEAAQAAAPGNPMFTAMLADLLVRANDPGRAVSTLLARPGMKGTPMLLASLARAQAAAGRPEEAIATYAELLRASPADRDARTAQVGLLLQARRLDEARASLREGLARTPGTLGFMSTLVALAGGGGGVDAALQTAAELRRDPANLPAAGLLQGDALVADRQFAQAARAYQLEFDREATRALTRRLTAAYEAAGQDEEAARVLRRWLAGHPDDPDAAGALALLAATARRWDEAQANFEIVLAKRPADPVALNDLAWLYQLKGDKRARDLAQRAYLQSPSAHTGDTLGWILLQQGQTKAAIIVLQQALQRGPDSAATYHLAVALQQDGQAEAAVKLLQPLVAGPAAFDDRAAATQLLGQLGPT